MKAIVFYVTLPLLYFISILPFPLLYAFSYCVYILLYYVIGYRKKVVHENLKKSFPEKSEKEIHKLKKEFYRYLCDLATESFKTLTISKKKMIRHCSIKKSAGELLDKLHDEKHNVILVMGHFGNWEWAGNTFSFTRQH